MNRSQKGGVALSLVIIAVGIGWLLNVYAVFPGVNWVWTGTLAVAGVLALTLGGLNQLTVLVGPFLILASFFSILRQTGRMSVDVEVPVLVIAFGVLLLLSHVLRLPPAFRPDGNEGQEK